MATNSMGSRTDLALPLLSLSLQTVCGGAPSCRDTVLSVQYSTVQYSTVQYSTVQCSSVQYSTVAKKKFKEKDPVEIIKKDRKIRNRREEQTDKALLPSGTPLLTPGCPNKAPCFKTLP